MTHSYRCNLLVDANCTLLTDDHIAQDGDDELQTQLILKRMGGLGFQLNSTVFYYLDKGGQHSEAYW